MRKIAENYELPYYTISPTYSVCTEHGYISGEVYTCPVCNKPTEVYSRITGYYRPVQNWNIGKTEEFKERKEYDISKSRFVAKKQAFDKNEKEAKASIIDGIMLFTTKTCPNCKIAKNMLDKKGLAYKVMDAEENVEFCQELGIMQAPTLVVAKQGKTSLYKNISDIKQYIE